MILGFSKRRQPVVACNTTVFLPPFFIPHSSFSFFHPSHSKQCYGLVGHQLVTFLILVTIIIRRVMDLDCCIISLNCLCLGCFRIERPRHINTEPDRHTHTHNPFKSMSGSYRSINQSTNPKEETEREGGRGGNRVSLQSRKEG